MNSDCPLSQGISLIIVSTRLKAFLPQLEQANAVLDQETSTSGGLEDVAVDGEYIEMVFFADSQVGLI